MNREIKFRGKRVDNGEWVYGNLLRIETCFIVPFVTNGSWIKKELMLKFLSPCYEVDAKTVGEFSGVKDINGKEMYEGDIVQAWGGEYCQGFRELNIIGEVKWQSNGFDIVKDNVGYGWEFADHFDYIVVLGDKFENPDLLEVD